MASFFSLLKTERTATNDVPHASPGQGRCVRLHWAILSSQAAALHGWATSIQCSSKWRPE